MPVEIVGESETGGEYRLCEFRPENELAERMTGARKERALERLRALAERVASRWRGVFPRDRIEVTRDDQKN